MNLRTWIVTGASALLGLCLSLAVIRETIAQSPPGYVRDIPGERTPPSPRLPKPVAASKITVDETTIAMELAKASESDYRNAIDANKKQAGTIADAEVEQLRRNYTDNMLAALRKQVESQQAQI